MKSRITTRYIFVEGILVGGITGLVGAGGGFLIIPALVLLAGLPMKQAVGTSLLIIALKSLIGFTGDLGSGLEIDYKFMLFFSAFAMVGILAGSYLTRYIPNEKLKPAFGWFVLVMAVYYPGKGNPAVSPQKSSFSLTELSNKSGLTAEYTRKMRPSRSLALFIAGALTRDPVLCVHITGFRLRGGMTPKY
ncbi:MAG: sulfite exporter TauE/SafE family protein [Cytophagales bacterium]|nr:sulfite exporter TauE/SafE family protein [Cytophagales bacterium]